MLLELKTLENAFNYFILLYSDLSFGGVYHFVL